MGVVWDEKFNYLLNKGLLQQISDKKVNINNKNRIYNPSKLSKVLTKAVDSLYKKQYPKESKPKRRFRNVKKYQKAVPMYCYSMIKMVILFKIGFWDS